MAETKKKKTSPAAKGGSKKASAASKATKQRSSMTAAEKKFSPKKGKQNAKKGSGEQMSAPVKKKNYFAENYMVYVLLAVGLFLAVAYVLDALSGDASPKDHYMSYVGYYLCYGVFGIFGWMAYVIPAGLIWLGICWKKYCEERVVVLKVLLSALLIFMTKTFSDSSTDAAGISSGILTGISVHLSRRCLYSCTCPHRRGVWRRSSSRALSRPSSRLRRPRLRRICLRRCPPLSRV